jgi:hypothetical protein
VFNFDPLSPPLFLSLNNFNLAKLCNHVLTNGGLILWRYRFSLWTFEYSLGRPRRRI